jgi:hypothetical protein
MNIIVISSTSIVLFQYFRFVTAATERLPTTSQQIRWARTPAMTLVVHRRGD